MSSYAVRGMENEMNSTHGEEASQRFLVGYVSYMNNRLQIIMTELGYQEKFALNSDDLRKSRDMIRDAVVKAAKANAELVATISRLSEQMREEHDCYEALLGMPGAREIPVHGHAHGSETASDARA